MSKTDALRLPEYLHHIVEAIERIHQYVEDMSEVAFLGDRKTQDAVIRNFEIIGEASRNIERYHKKFAATAYADQHSTQTSSASHLTRDLLTFQNNLNT